MLRRNSIGTLFAVGVLLLTVLFPLPVYRYTLARPLVHIVANSSYAPNVFRPIRKLQTAMQAVYTVRPGDSLSGIAYQKYGRADAWPILYQANRSIIPNPNLIYPQQVLLVPPLPVHWSPPAIPAASGPRPATLSRSYTPAAQPNGRYVVRSGFQSCVIARESGGNAQVWNASGHYGLYQFSYSTWTAHGGSPALFGHASGTYQTYVFWNTVREDGTSDWWPYDGC